MIKLIGLGLSLDTLTIGAIYKLLKCNKIYMDTYTSYWYPSIKELISILKSLGLEAIEVFRRDLEGISINGIVEEAKYSDICIAVAGDPMIATTHSAIIVEAISRGVNIEIQPASSILNIAISLSCLQAYRFGKIVTVVKPKNGIIYDYPIQVIKMNRDLNLHTLLLLEIDIERNYYMNPKEAIEILLTIQKNIKETILSQDDKIIILKSIGSKSGMILVETIEDILNKEYKKDLYTLIIPSKTLHPIEKECLQNIDKIKIATIEDTKILKSVITAILFDLGQKLI